MNIILFGGSFDPIHLGHIKMAARAASIIDGIVYFIPAKIGIWKGDSVSPEDKLAMLKLALKDYPNFRISTIELDNATDHTYTINTVKYFAELFPDDNLFLLIGGDQACLFDKWKQADDIATMASIIYYPRKGYIPSKEIIERFKIREIGGPTYEASSTDIRNLYDLSINPDVLRYIADHDLYFMKKIKPFYTEKRYKHAISVANTALEIVENSPFGMNSTYGMVYIAGLLHDIAKKAPLEEQLEYMEINYPQYVCLPPPIYHQFLGADYAERFFEIDNEIILDAIRYHTTGRANMTVLDKIIYCADKIEPLRGFDASDLMASLKKDIDKGFIDVLNANHIYFKEHGFKEIEGLPSECFKFYRIQ